MPPAGGSAVRRHAADADYVFSTAFGERLGEKRIRKVFYAVLVRAGMGHRRDEGDPRGNPQMPIRLHDLRHSWCTWAVNVWPLTKVQSYAGHSDVETTQRYVHHQTKAQDADLGGAYLEAALAESALVGHRDSLPVLGARRLERRCPPILGRSMNRC